MKSHIDTTIVIELEKNEVEAFKNLNQLSEDSDIAFIDIEVRDNTKIYFITPCLEAAKTTIKDSYPEESSIEMKIVNEILDKIKEVEDFNYIEVRGIK